MEDLIKRIDAIKELRNEYPSMPFFKSLREEWAIKTEGYRKAEEVIMRLPPADTPKPIDASACYNAGYTNGYKRGKTGRPQGEWTDKNGHTMFCSECGFEEAEWHTVEYNFCPNCGARMKDVTERLESRTDLIWYGDKTDLIGDETGRHTGWFGKGADDETD